MEEEIKTEETIKAEDIVSELSKDDLLKMLAKVRKDREEDAKKKEEEKQTFAKQIEEERKKATEEKKELEKKLEDADQLLKTTNISGVNMADLPTLEDVAKAIDENPEVLRRNFDKYPKKTIERIQMKARLAIDNLMTDLIDENIDADGNSIHKQLTEIKEFYDKYQSTEQFDGEFLEGYTTSKGLVDSLILKLEKWQKNSGQIAIIQAAVWVAYIHYLAKVGDIDEDSIAVADTEDAKYSALVKELGMMKKKLEALEEKKEENSSTKLEEEQKKEQQELLEKIDGTTREIGAGDEDDNPDASETSVDEKPRRGKKKL